jgi:hypothetical protein
MLDAQRRFLAAMLDACAGDPAAHRHQIAALDREIALAADATSPEGFLGASGSLEELITAMRLDRAANRLRVAVAVQDRPRAAAAVAEYGGADPAPPDEAASAFTRLTLMRVESGWRPAAELAEHIAGAEATLREADPGFDPGAPEYRRRTPWPSAPAVPVDFPSIDPGPWLRRLRERPAGPPVPFADGTPFPEPIPPAPGPLRARVEEGRARLAEWPEPLLARHWDELDRALAAARTPTEVELAADYAGACLAIESDWNLVLHATLLAPLRAACAGAPGEIVVARRAADLLDREQPLGAWQGEAGFELLQDLAWVADADAIKARVRRVESSPATLWDQSVTVDDPSAARRPVPASEPPL